MVTKGVIYKEGLMVSLLCRSPPSLITTRQSQQTNKQTRKRSFFFFFFFFGTQVTKMDPNHVISPILITKQGLYVCMYVCTYVCMYVCMYVAPESKTIIACYSNNPCKKWALLFHKTSESACDYTDK